MCPSLQNLAKHHKRIICGLMNMNQCKMWISKMPQKASCIIFETHPTMHDTATNLFTWHKKPAFHRVYNTNWIANLFHHGLSSPLVSTHSHTHHFVEIFLGWETWQTLHKYSNDFTVCSKSHRWFTRWLHIKSNHMNAVVPHWQWIIVRWVSSSARWICSC